MSKINPIEFCNWLQGASHMSPEGFDERQTQLVRDKLNGVFEHAIDPERDSETTVDREDLQQIHDGEKSVSQDHDVKADFQRRGRGYGRPSAGGPRIMC